MPESKRRPGAKKRLQTKRRQEAMLVEQATAQAAEADVTTETATPLRNSTVVILTVVGAIAVGLLGAAVMPYLVR